ncbi:MAG: efflux RND transporter periplasmic adaptor subunit [Rhodopila sp.]|jgi:RND family efflux transporter MFP subunit
MALNAPSVLWCGTVSLLVSLIVASPHNAMAQGGPPAPKVVISRPIAKRVPRWDEFTGRFEPIEQVEVRPRVSGFIDQIHFKDGEMVQKDDVLFTIDPRPYQIAADSAKADVMKAKAQVVFAFADYERGEQLVASRTVPVKELEQRKANLDTATATEESADAALRNADLNLQWTEVRAPLGGRISDRKVDVGNLVAGGQGTSTTLLTTIVRLDPIYFVFEASEADYLRYSRQAVTGGPEAARDAPTPVQINLADETGWPHHGVMNFVDNRLSSRSGTIRGRAILDNKDLFLTPGTFGRIRVFGGDIDALLIPDQAISSDQANKIVMTVGPDNKIVPKPVILGPMAEGLRVITSGLAATDQVVISGIANPFVRPGALVDPIPGDIRTAEK